jgi:hypothetical protein
MLEEEWEGLGGDGEWQDGDGDIALTDEACLSPALKGEAGEEVSGE